MSSHTQPRAGRRRADIRLGAMDLQRPQCDCCEGYVDTLLATMQESNEENRELHQRVAQMKQRHSEDKRRHSEINNQIIMSNVKYQQALNQAHTLVQKYIREREDFMRKEVVAAAQEAEMEAIRLVNAKIMDLLTRSLEESHHHTKSAKSVVNQLRSDNARVTPKDPWIPIPTKGLHMRTESESNSASYLAAASKVTKPISKPPSKPALKPTTKSATMFTTKPATKTKAESKIKKSVPAPEPDEEEKTDLANVSMDSNMSIDCNDKEEVTTTIEAPTENNNNNYQQNEVPLSNMFFPTKETLTNKRKVDSKANLQSETKSINHETNEDATKSNAVDHLQEVPEGRKYGLRKSMSKSYVEPSLNTKLRRGDSHPNIIPEYVVRSYAAPIRSQDKENLEDE